MHKYRKKATLLFERKKKIKEYKIYLICVPACIYSLVYRDNANKNTISEENVLYCLIKITESKHEMVFLNKVSCLKSLGEQNYIYKYQC